jgi:agmatinase
MGLHNPQLRLDELNVAVVGVPYDGSVSHAAGAANAPAVLRGISKQLWPHTENLVSLEGLKLRDLGDVAVDSGDAVATQRAITAMIEPLVRAGVIPVVLGGDHSVTSAVLAAFADRDDLGVLWMDSHPDLMDTFGSIRGKEESPWSHACPLRRICELDNVQADNVLLLGVRDFIPQELRYVREQGIEVMYAHEVSRMSAQEAAERIGRKFAGLSGVYISFDIDVLDPAFAPGTGVPIPGGMSSRYLYDLILRLFEREEQSLRRSGEHFLQILGFDVVEIAPPLDVGRITSLAGMGIITNMLGCLALQLGLAGV